jgi:hypothetical protein
MKKALIILFVLVCSGIRAQNLVEWADPLAKFQVQNLDLISLDTRDQIFVTTTTGDILLFDQAGKQINLYSPPRQGRLQQIEASWTVNIFSFSADLQEYRILDRFLNPLSENSFMLNDIVLPKAATLGNNTIVWVWDESDLSLKSLDYLRNNVLQTQPLNLILDSENLSVSEIREFKNRLFMNFPQSGIFIFDNQGNYLQKVNLRIDQRLCFYRENLFWIESGNLKRVSIGSKDIVDMGPLPSTGIISVQVGQEIIVLASRDQIEVYALPASLRKLR